MNKYIYFLFFIQTFQSLQASYAYESLQKIPLPHSEEEAHSPFEKISFAQQCFENLKKSIPQLSKEILDPGRCGEGKANINIVLSKYWGKRIRAFNFPDMPSVSIALPFETKTLVFLAPKEAKRKYSLIIKRHNPNQNLPNG